MSRFLRNPPPSSREWNRQISVHHSKPWIRKPQKSHSSESQRSEVRVVRDTLAAAGLLRLSLSTDAHCQPSDMIDPTGSPSQLVH